MKTITELREARAKVWAAMESFLDTHQNDKGVLSAEDDATYNKMEQDLTDLSTEIKRMERKEAIEAELNKPVSAPLTAKPMTATDDTEPKGRGSKGYKKSFWNAMRKKTVASDVLNALSEGTDSEGGFLVPDTFETTLIDTLNDELVIRKLAHNFTTASGAHKIPVVSAHGAASWTDENATITEGNQKFGQKSIGAHKLTALIKVSEELLNDAAFNLESYFSQEFIRQIANAEDEAFVLGDGTDRPFGLLDDTEGGEIGVTTAATNAITADELIDLYHSLRAPYRKNAVWILNDATIQAVRKLKDENKQYIWQPSLAVGVPDTLLGRPVYSSANIPTIAAGAKVAIFGDLSYYWIGDRNGITFKRLNELYADKGQVGFLATKRVDARLVLPEAVKILKIKGASA